MGEPTATAVLEKDLATIVREVRAPECWDDPYPYYHRLRQRAPVLRTADGKFVVTGHRLSYAVLKDSRWGPFPEFLCMSNQVFGKKNPGSAPHVPGRPEVLQSLPDRASLHSRLAREFTPRTVRPLRASIQELADELLDDALSSDTFDLIDAVVMPFTSTVLAEAFGVPAVDRQLFRKWSVTLRRDAEARDGGAEAGFVPAKAEPADVAQTSREIDSYVKGLIAERRRAPGDDLLSMLLSEAGEAGNESEWSDDRVTSVTVSIIIAGHFTTTALIGNGARTLMSHPEQASRLRRSPEIITQAVEELLRFDTPSQFVSRYALAEMELGGERIAPGDGVLVLLGAANRDPSVFPDPDRLDLTRTPNDHLAFSHGQAYCFGAPLARLAIQVIFAAMARRAPEASVAGDPVYLDTIGLRGLSSLPVRVR